MLSSALPLVFLLSGWGLFGSVSGSSVVEEAFRDVVNLVAPGQEYLTEVALHSLFNTLENRVQCGEVPCGKCDLVGGVHELIHDHAPHSEEKAGKSGENVSVSLSEFSHFAAGSVLYLKSPSMVCSAIAEGAWRARTEQFLHNITHTHSHHAGHSSREDNGHTHSHMDIHGLEIVFEELKHHYEPLPHEICMIPSGIMAEVNASGHQQVEVGAVLGRVLLHALQGHCFTDKLLPNEKFFLDYIIKKIGSENFTTEGLAALMTTLNIGVVEPEHDHDHGHVHGLAGHDHGRSQKQRSSHDHPEEHDDGSTWDHHCFTAEDLVSIYGLPENGSFLGRTDVDRVSPAFIQQIISGACAHVTEPTVTDSLSTAERYLYATLANVVITLTAMFGVVMLLFSSCTSAFQYCIQFCISLAVGSLTGDALFHLLPVFLGLHVHDHGSTHSHTEVPDYFRKMLVVVAAVYFFYLMESIFSLTTRKDHGENEMESDPHHCDHGRVLEMYQRERAEKNKSQSASRAELVDYDNDTPAEVKERTGKFKVLPLMITIGDGIHNFADGLAMGAAFALSWKSGLVTSLAVFCHELPHELGDFAILLHSGLSVKKSLLLNVGSAMMSFIGLYIGLSVSTDPSAQQWIAAITTGLFLYVGLADMMPTLVHVKSKKPWLVFALQNAGILTGWTVMILLSLYEGSIKV